MSSSSLGVVEENDSSNAGGDSSLTTTSLQPTWLIMSCCAAITFQLFRVSIFLVRTASDRASQDYTEDHHKATKVEHDRHRTPKKTNKNGLKTYGSFISSQAGSSTAPKTPDNKKGGGSKDEEDQLLLPQSPSNDSVLSMNSTYSSIMTAARSIVNESIWSYRIQAVLGLLFLWKAIFFNASKPTDQSSSEDEQLQQIPQILIWTGTIAILVNATLTRSDLDRTRFGTISRILSFCTCLSIYFPCALLYYANRRETTIGDELFYNGIGLYVVVSMVEILFAVSKTPKDDKDRKSKGKKRLSREALLTILKPYFWPDSTVSESATTNRIRAILTWVCVILSKVCNLIAPILLGWASTALAHQQYITCMWYAVGYAALGFFGSLFKEGQSLIYLKVAQAAFCQLSETVFVHLHQLSLDWHLRKKLGQVVRSLDRGIAACDTLMKYMFLWLVPALAESLVVCIIFATYFSYLPLAIAVFYYVWVYIVWTILVTLWRKKFRKAVVHSDNEWHDRCTDSLVNFETVKYFTAEDYERRRFGESVQNYQQGSVMVQASLSFLNASQKIILQLCLATALSLSAYGIKKRHDCCIIDHGCDSGVSDCCLNIDNNTCPGMQVGDFVAVLTYTLQLFGPLNFLGSVYNAVVMAIIDLTNLSELLAESPDVTDAPDAIPLPVVKKKKKTPPSPASNDEPDPDGTITTDIDGTITTATTGTDSETAPMLDNLFTAAANDDADNEEEEEEEDDVDDVAVEFDNVIFHYPTQSASQGLKGVSFQMKRGTTTAIVGPTGAGKTTISRLLFRFYDVLGGAVKVNGVDIRTVTQKSLRGSLGVVPQNACMFNDTLRANILYGRRDATHEELCQAIIDAQLQPFINSLEDGWDTIVGDRGLKLSGGEKQRAAIARCLLKDPPFVLLDEATSALDTITEKSVQEALDRLGSERTVLVIAHRLGTIRNADNIIVLKDGYVAEQGTHDELLELNGVYADMWNLQLHSGSRSSSRSDLNIGMEFTIDTKKD